MTSSYCIHGCRNASVVEMRCLGLSVSSFLIRSMAGERVGQRRRWFSQPMSHCSEVGRIKTFHAVPGNKAGLKATNSTVSDVKVY